MLGVINDLLERFTYNYNLAEGYMTGGGLIFTAIFVLCLYIVYKILAWPFTKKAPSKPTETPIITEAPTKPTIPPKPTDIPTKPTTTEAPEDNKEEEEEEQPIEIPEIKLDTNTIILMFAIVVLAIVAIVFFMTRKQQPKRKAPAKHR